MTTTATPILPPYLYEPSACEARAARLAQDSLRSFGERCDRTFVAIILLQWIGACVATLWLSPRTWNGLSSEVHPHVYAAVFLGGLLSSLPIWLALRFPGHLGTRHVIAVAQMGWSALLIHLTGGRIETHFHVFGSLAFLAWYRDWRVLVTATLLTGLDHSFRGWIAPASVFGVLEASSWRTFEHVFWVLFEDAFLLIAMRRSLDEVHENSRMRAELEQGYQRIAEEVRLRTADLLRAEEHARAGESFLSRVGDVAGVGGWQIDLATQSLLWSEETFRLHDVPPGMQPTVEEAIAFYRPDARPAIAAAVNEGMTQGKAWDLELPLITAKGREIFVRAVGEVEFENGKPVRLVGAVQDITARKAMEDALRSAAGTDKLTGLPNRSHFSERLQQAVRRARDITAYHFAVLFLDFDRFKNVNDILGHEVGDRLLKQIAERLRTTVESDSSGNDGREHVTARLGGDEFVVLLEGIGGPDDARRVATRLLEAFVHSYRLGQHEVYSTASIGIVVDGGVCGSAEDVLRDADTAMYEAKLAGKAQYVMFDVSMRQRVQNRVDLENDLRKALDAGQLFLMYQPIVALGAGHIESFEALLRWQHPQRGLISPSEFVPIAEDTGLILPIGEWVLREACGRFAHWRQTMGDAAPRSISVNVSRKQLLLPGLVDILRQTLAETGIPASSLHLEVTESAVMQDVVAATRMLHAIKGLGVHLDMDDFGTGYSSLACLHQFPLDVLKIDRSFVANIERGRDFAALVSAVTQLARNLNIAVVAEGIETVEQSLLLQSLDCEFGQGYFFSKPLLPEQVESFRIPTGVLLARSESMQSAS